MDKIAEYQRKCWGTYKTVTSFDNSYSYLYGNPVKVHVPVDVCCNNLMIVGAYPTAHFQTINNIRDVPIGDHLYPFSNDVYFDGSSTRYVNSGLELETLFLKPLGLTRGDCWITDLIKVFLFKEGHIRKYNQLGHFPLRPNRQKFTSIAEKSLVFLMEEISICKPKLVLLLGEEVNSVILKLSHSKCLNYLNNPDVKVQSICGNEYNTIGAPHPGILMREDKNNGKWNSVIRTKTLPLIKKQLNLFINQKTI